MKRLWIALSLVGGAFLTALISKREGLQGGGNAPSPYPTLSAIQELNRWHGLVETDSSARPLLDKYWAVLGQSQPSNVAWSGAFISYVMRGVRGFVPSGSHLEYARAAYRNNGRPGLYGAFPPTASVDVGDIIIRSRGDIPSSYADVISPTGFKPTHGDIVVSIERGFARVIGGNVDNSVTQKAVPLRNNGAVDDPTVIAVLKLQAGLPIA